MRFCGIDPGVNGGVAVIDESGKARIAAKMPATERELWDLLAQVAADGDVVAVLEQLGGMPRSSRPVKCKRCGAVTMTTAPLQTPKTMLTMGTNYGLLRMGLTAAGIRFDEAVPRKWQAVFGLVFSGKKLTSTQKKNRHKAKAEHLFPGIRITHAVADALLIAEFCRRTMVAGAALTANVARTQSHE